MRRAHFQWTRQLGTSAADQSHGVSADGLGNVYISGYTTGSLGGPNAGGDDAFVSKYDAAGNSSGRGSWELVRMTIATACRPTAWGTSTSRATPTAAWAGQTPAATTRLSASTMRRATSSGRGSWELVRLTMSYGVSADGLGNVYFSGYTAGSLGGPNAGGSDAFVAKIVDPVVPEPSTLLLLCFGSLIALGTRQGR